MDRSSSSTRTPTRSSSIKLLEARRPKAPGKGRRHRAGGHCSPEGRTSFKPGPIVGDLQQAGIPAGIEGGKVVIKDNKVVVEERRRSFPPKLAEMLTRLEIFPMEIGLNLKAVIEGHTTSICLRTSRSTRTCSTGMFATGGSRGVHPEHGSRHREQGNHCAAHTERQYWNPRLWQSMRPSSRKRSWT